MRFGVLALMVLCSCGPAHDTSTRSTFMPDSGAAASAPSTTAGAQSASTQREQETTRQLPNTSSAAGSTAAPLEPAAGSGGVSVSVTPVSGAQALASPKEASAAEWRMMGYDEKNWYFNPHETALSVDNAKQLSEKWRFKVSGIPLGTPVVAEGKVFALASGGTYAIDFETGQQVWLRDDITGTASLTYANGFVYVQNSLPPRVYKLNAKDGTTVWGPVRNCDDDSTCAGESSPILVGDTLYIGMERNLAEASFSAQDCTGVRGGVRALAADTGMERWVYHTIPDAAQDSENGASVWSTIAVDPESRLVFATTGNNYTLAGPDAEAMHAIDLTTGQRRWVHQVRNGDVYSAADLLADLNVRDLDFGANPILAEVNGRQIVAAGEKGATFWVFDRQTGEVVWSRSDLSASHDALHGGVFISGAFDGQAFYVVSNDPKSGGAVVHRLDAAQGMSTWSRQLKETTWGATSLANGLLFVPNNTTLYVLNAQTGEVLRQFETGGTIGGGAAAIVQGRVVVKSGMAWTDPSVQLNDQIICYALPNDTTEAPAGSPSSGGAGASAPPMAASFSALYQRIIVDDGCNSGQCHSQAASGSLDMSSRDLAYVNLVGVAAMGTGANGACGSSGLVRVTPGDAQRSLLVAKLEHTQSCGAPMPNAGTRLPSEQLQLVRAWITAGAKND